MIKLSILIPHIRKHYRFFHLLKNELAAQILPYAGQVEILDDDHEYDTIGVKRNRLLERATGVYLCFFDADDTPSFDYIQWLMKAIKTDCDCASLLGMYSVNGVQDGVFEHSLKYKEWRTTANEVKYERYPNHLNLIRSSIAKQFIFPSKSHGEDHDWSTQIHMAGVLKKEYTIPEIIYYYNKLTT